MSPTCISIPENSNTTLNSSEIDKSKLKSVQSVLDRHQNLQNESKAPTLAWKIAKDAVFGELILKQCTPLGNRELPGLPTAELMELKTAIFNQFPQFWKNPAEFEDLWRKCLESIQQGCKRLRLPRK